MERRRRVWTLPRLLVVLSLVGMWVPYYLDIWGEATFAEADVVRRQLTRYQLEQVRKAHIDDVHQCLIDYPPAAADRSVAAFWVRMKVDPSGVPTHLHLQPRSFEDTDLGACVLNEVETWRFAEFFRLRRIPAMNYGFVVDLIGADAHRAPREIQLGGPLSPNVRTAKETPQRPR